MYDSMYDTTNNPEQASQATIEPRFLRRKEAARLIGLSPSQFDHLRRAGYLPRPVQLGPAKGGFGWSKDVLDRYVEASTLAGHLLTTAAWEAGPELPTDHP